LPEDLKVTSTIINEPTMIMGVEHVSRPIFGVQFHPESIDTDHGMQLIKNFINI
jgi:anthranilate/para-aminobenzoate synthase component II